MQSVRPAAASRTQRQRRGRHPASPCVACLGAAHQRPPVRHGAGRRGAALRGDSPAPVASPAVPNRAAITASIMLATFMQGVDTTITNVALPHMQGSLSAAQDQIAWVVTSYIVAAAIMTPLTGWLAGRFGIKYVFLFSVIGFTLASALCGAATSLSQLVAYRLLQGVCGAALVPLSQAVLFQINPPERHAKAMAVWGMGVILGPIIGPALGGYLTDFYNWRWVFYINLPFGVLAAIGILVFIHDTRRAHREPFDFFGFAALSLGIGTMIAMIICSRLIGRVDIRLVIMTGLALTALALWQMTGFTTQMDTGPVITSGLLQGLGLGFIFTPLSTVTFSTLPRQILTQGTAIFSLMRNIGGSIGISIVVALLAENTQIVHSRLVEHLRPDNPLAQAPFLAHPFSLTNPSGIAALNAEATRQAAMVAYIDDFKLMMLLVIMASPLILLLRTPRRPPTAAPAAAE